MLAALSPATASAAFDIDWADGLLTVTADAVARAVVVREVADRAGIDVVGLETIGEAPVTVRLVRVSPLEALRRLLDDVPSVFLEERAAGGDLRLVGVHLFGRTHDGAREVAGGPGLDAADAAALRAALLQVDDEPLANAAVDLFEARDPAAMIRELLVAVRSDARDERLHAMRLLDRAASVDSATLVAAMSEAVEDDDDAIKAFAIRALAVRGSDGFAVLRRAFRDADRDGRLMVLQAVSERDRESALLREALSDSDPTVRQFAASRLSRTDTPGGG